METQRIIVKNPSARRMTPAQKAWFSKSPSTRAKYKAEVYGKRAADELKRGGVGRRPAAKRKPPPAKRPATPKRLAVAAPKKKRNVTSIVRVEPVRRAAPKKINAGSVAVYTPRKAPLKRNPAGLFGVKLPPQLGQAAGVITGGISTKLIMDNLIPPAMRVGIFGYLTSALIAMGQGWAAGQVLGRKVGNDMQLGGWVYTALRIAQDVMPPFAGFVNPFGMGEIVQSSFPMPPVTYPGDLNRYYIPRDTRDYVARQIAEAHAGDSIAVGTTTLNAEGVGPRDANGGAVTMDNYPPESASNSMGSYGGAAPGAWAA